MRNVSMLAFVLLSMIYGCKMKESSGVAYLARFIEPFVGHDVSEIVLDIGLPDKSINTLQNFNYYTWIKRSTKRSPSYGYHFTVPLESELFGHGERTIEYEQEEKHFECKLIVQTDKQDIVVNYHVLGECDSKDVFFD